MRGAAELSRMSTPDEDRLRLLAQGNLMEIKLAQHKLPVPQPQQAYDYCLRAEQARQNLEKSVEEVERYLANSSERSGTTCRLVEVAKRELSQQKAAHDGLLKFFPLQTRGSRDASVLVEKLTSLPELLEEILLYLPNSDLLNAMQVCHLLNDAITSSAKIARMMGLKEHLSNKVYFPTVNLTLGLDVAGDRI